MMRWRWMMAYEIFEQKKLHLMEAVPRKWMQTGKELELDGLRTHYGPLYCQILCEEDRISAKIRIGAQDFPVPEQITIRLPHPEGKKAKSWSAGQYDAENERFIPEAIFKICIVPSMAIVPEPQNGSHKSTSSRGRESLASAAPSVSLIGASFDFGR